MAERDRSRSPHATTYDEIARLVVMREQARLGKDWNLADAIRERLTTSGVTLYDKTNTWRSSDGQTGRIPTWSEIEAGQTPEGIIAQQEAKVPAMPEADGSEAYIKSLVVQREQARAGKDWAQADKLREELKALGVEVFDNEKMWRAKSGASGVIIGYRGAAGPSDLEISKLVVQREKARQGSDFNSADMIRNELKALGVEINDREKTWRSNDGRQGAVPSWSDVQAGTAGGGAALVPALPPMAAVPVQQSNVNNLRNQVVQAALAAAQNPATAARTLQLLQQAAVGSPATVAAPKGYGKPPAAMATAPVARSPEAQEAIDAIAQIQASGRLAQDAEIDWMVGIREKCRQARDFASADELRAAMRSSLGVELYEKEKKWTCTDGRQGVIPMWDGIGA